jgi:hypothetical protein
VAASTVIEESAGIGEAGSDIINTIARSTQGEKPHESATLQ